MTRTPASAALEKLEIRFKQVSALNAASAILGWDALTMLPPKSVEGRGEQLAALAEVAH
jgi:carboxypeptidase Taq